MTQSACKAQLFCEVVDFESDCLAFCEQGRYDVLFCQPHSAESDQKDESKSAWLEMQEV